MRRTKEEAMRTRMSIMESALDIFSEKNFANASVSEITARIGLSKGAFYWHFKNKQDILINLRQCRDDLRCEFWATGEFIGREGAFHGLSEGDHSLSSPGMIPMYGPSSSSSEHLG